MHFFILTHQRTYEKKKNRRTEYRKADLNYISLRSTYLPVIVNYVCRNNGSREDAEDIFQDAVIIYLRKVERGNTELRCQPATYLFSIARNLWKKKLRRKSIHSSAIENINIPVIEEPAYEYIGHAPLTQRLKKAFARLPCPCRRLLNYFYFHKKRYNEIIEILGISSVQVAKNQKLRCMKKLKSLITELSDRSHSQ